MPIYEWRQDESRTVLVQVGLVVIVLACGCAEHY